MIKLTIYFNLKSGVNMETLKLDLRKLPILFLGFIFLSVGVMLTKRAELGMDSWGVFHLGLAENLNLSLGTVIQLLGLIILILSIIFLKTKIGIGTILNVALVGYFIDYSDKLYTYVPDSTIEKFIILIFGILFLTFGRGLYISTKLGAGPRDGLFVGLSRITKIDVKYVKPAIEFTVLILGFLLGGIVGVGTIILIVFSGYLVQYFFKILKFDPKAENQRKFSDYLPKNQKVQS